MLAHVPIPDVPAYVQVVAPAVYVPADDKDTLPRKVIARFAIVPDQPEVMVRFKQFTAVRVGA